MATGVAEPFLPVSSEFPRDLPLCRPPQELLEARSRRRGPPAAETIEPRSVSSGTPAMSPKAPVAEENRAAGFEERGAVAHRVQQHEVRMRGAFDGRASARPRGPDTTSASTWPVRMASSVASASCSRPRSRCSADVRRLGARPFRLSRPHAARPHELDRTYRAQVQTRPARARCPRDRRPACESVQGVFAPAWGARDLIAHAPVAGASGDRSPRCGIGPADAPRRFS